MNEPRLNANLSSPGSMRAGLKGGGVVVIDPTLSVEGAAADAKAVGDALAEITSITNEQIDALFE